MLVDHKDEFMKHMKECGIMVSQVHERNDIHSAVKKFKEKLDPRKYNGAIFLGLNGPVVKSHGGTDFIGFSNSLDVCGKIVEGDLINKIRENIN